MKRTSLPTAALCLAAVTPAAHGTERAYSLSGGITFTAQHVDDDRVDAEGLASGDLFVTAPFLGGDWTLHFEGSVTPETGRVASVVGEANTDAGTVRSPGRRGNAQISEIRYERRLAGGRTLTLGMLETAAWFDSAATAIDENAQFMGLSFKHNLTIEFPDYTLGAVYQHPLSADGAELRVGLSSSHGLADNPGASYAQALDINGDDKGAFAIAAALWPAGAWRGELGAWTHTAPHHALDGGPGEKHNYGAYLVLGREWDDHAFDVRLGRANPEVFEAEAFVALTWEWRRPEAIYGVGAARTFLSDDAAGPGRDDMSQYEIYARFRLTDGLELTPHIQRVDNSGFDSSGAAFARSLNVIGLRLAWSR